MTSSLAPGGSVGQFTPGSVAASALTHQRDIENVRCNDQLSIESVVKSFIVDTVDHARILFFSFFSHRVEELLEVYRNYGRLHVYFIVKILPLFEWTCSAP